MCQNGGAPNNECSQCICAPGFTGDKCETTLMIVILILVKMEEHAKIDQAHLLASVHLVLLVKTVRQRIIHLVIVIQILVKLVENVQME